MLEWIVGRLDGSADGVETPIGVVPTKDALNLDGLDVSDADLDVLLDVDLDIWRQEAALIPEHFETFGDHLPAALWTQYEALVARLGAGHGLTPTSAYAAGVGLRDLVYRGYERRLAHQLTGTAMPRHVGVLLDGNRRWARAVGQR